MRDCTTLCCSETNSSHYFTLACQAVPHGGCATIISEKEDFLKGKMVVTIYGISQCDTVKKARAWLGNERVLAHFHDFKRDGVPLDELSSWLEAFGWERLVNRAGTTWRRLGADRQAQVVDAESARLALIENASLIKRPVVRWQDGQLTLGFKPEVFEAHRPKV